MSDYQSLLLIKPGSFGDVVHALPCAAALKRHDPAMRLTWLVDERWEPLLADNPFIDEVVVFPRQRFRRLDGKLRSVPWALDLKRFRPDVALDLQGLLRSGLMAKCSRARRIVGLSDAREGGRWFYDEVATVQPGEHSVRRYLRALDALGVPQPENPEFTLPEGTSPVGAPQGPFVLLHPFARGQGKSLTPEQVVTLCQELQPATVVLAGAGTPPANLPANTISLLNTTTISELIWLIRAADFVISVDSGPMHIAAAVTSRLVSIHTWSDPRLVGPFNEHAWIWQGGELRQQRLGEVTLPEARSPENADMWAIGDFVRKGGE
jgi:heptosyltransferase I